MEEAIKMLKWHIKNIDRLYDKKQEIMNDFSHCLEENDIKRNNMILTRLENERALALEGLAAINP